MKTETLYKLIEQVINEVSIKELVATGDPAYIEQAIFLAYDDEAKDDITAAVYQLESEDFLQVLGTLLDHDEEFSPKQMEPIYRNMIMALNSVWQKNKLSSITGSADSHPRLLASAYSFLNRLSARNAAWYILELAGNPNTPENILKRLQSHWMGRVVTAATKNLENKRVTEEKKKNPCKKAKGKKFVKRVNGRCRSYGQSGKAKDGGARIRPGTKKGDAYCARSAKIKKCKEPPCANDLSRKKWKCRGKKSMK